jgi:ferredoxin
MATHAAGSDYKIVYPKHQPPFFHLNLQSFGELAGWHHSSPFKVGINTDVGSWFAYRLLILANTEFKPSSKVNSQSPCVSCPSSHHDQVLDLQTDLTDQSNSNSQLDSYPQSVQQTKPCVKQCPVNALTDQGDYDWKLCFNYRKQKHSLCQDRCLARMACPVAQQHAYTLEQIQYHYNLSRKHLL